MHTITLTISDETLQSLQTTSEQLSQEILLVVAVKLYELGRLSSGAAAVLAGVPRTEFLVRLAEYGFNTFSLGAAELAEDLANA
uniref:Uncharacterized protein n=1 Tax=Cyanothece sp. (strain PCC 7425 / ATCC 29141) TaxID=395961 RepID=B8HYS1_CYAP4